MTWVCYSLEIQNHAVLRSHTPAAEEIKIAYLGLPYANSHPFSLPFASKRVLLHPVTPSLLL